MKKGFINILIYIFLPTILISLFTRDINNKYYSLYLLISYLIILLYFIIKYKKEILTYLKDFKLKYLKTILIYFFIGFSLMILCNYIINYIIIPNGISNNELNNREFLLNNKIIYSILLTTIIPILEEITFRLEFKKNIKNKHLFLILSSITFALLHVVSSNRLIELIYIIPYFILGLTFSTIYLKTNNILSNIIAHSLNNTITLLIILLF